MATCGNCGSETRRVLSTMTSDGRLLPKPKDQCSHCAPELFQDGFAAPSDRRIWLEHEALPHLYSKMPDGSLLAKDSVLCGIQAAMDLDPDAEAKELAIAKKRARRRTIPLTKTEIERADQAWRPIVRRHYAEQARLDQADRDYTEAIVEKHLRRDHDNLVH